MTVQIITYPTRKKMNIGKDIMTPLGFRPLHTDFIGDEFRVTFVDGADNPQQSEDDQLKFKLTRLLIKTIENDTITFSDLKMLMRLERGLELQQSTVDKLTIIKQGGLSGIVQRIKNLFNL